MRAMSWYSESLTGQPSSNVQVGHHRLKLRAGLSVPIVDGDLYAGPVLEDDQVARVEAQEVELGCDQAQALDGGSFAAESTAQGMDLGRDANHVAEIVRQIACQPLKILRPP